MARMWRAVRLPLLGVLVAIGVTSSLDATGYFAFSALSLFPLLVLFAWIERLPPRRMGFVWGVAGNYGLAILYPVVVLGLIVLSAAVAGAVDAEHTQWSKAALKLVAIGVSTFVVAILTEEGFFRGWLIVTSLSHALWNAGAYVLFGFGTRSGALGVRNTALWGPEVGVLGVALNIAFALLLWRWWRVASPVRSSA